MFYGAEDGVRTRDLCLGKATLYQLSHSRILIVFMRIILFLQLLYNDSRKFKIKQLFFKIIFKIVAKIIIVKKLKYDERIVICCFKIHKSQLNVNIYRPFKSL